MDHDSIILTLQLAPPPPTSGPRNLSYLKPTQTFFVKKVQWRLCNRYATNISLTKDPTCSFALAFKQIREKYKEIQEEARRNKEPLKDLYKKLTQLKLDILEDSSLFQKEELQEPRTQFREEKLTKANCIRCMVCVKWWGVGDKPKKLLFTLLKEK